MLPWTWIESTSSRLTFGLCFAVWSVGPNACDFRIKPCFMHLGLKVSWNIAKESLVRCVIFSSFV